ncbi:S-4TM family putative pore-forming effector [Vibrio gallicus]|uniref:S-4TM family putative pore-forming effector n=1 Tax=Vibrio gallicus TaxID=190897 RepID=UPI0021C44DA6|nr:S-4TM family putative pore-forming effector [Vibrio gallicus]
MNGINVRQNEPESIDKLAAQKQIYSDAKVLQGCYLFLSVPVIMLLNMLVKPVLMNDVLGLGWNNDLTNFIAIFALALTISELAWLKPTISKLKEKAAKIQEDFDCYVYELEWNDILCCNKPSGTDVREFSDKYVSKGKSRGAFDNWYTSDVEQVSKVKGILLCQNENLGWDVIQREKFVKAIIWISVVSFILSCGVAIYLAFTVKSFILNAVIPSLPLICYAITNYYENREAIESKKRLKSAAKKVEGMGAPTMKYARNIQNLIFLNRSTNSLIFDWYYDWHKNTNQRGVSYATGQLVKKLI